MSELQNASIRCRFVRVVGHRRAALSRAAAMVALGIAGTVSAQTSWVGPAGVPSPWETPANWSSGSVPNGEVALINNGGIARITSNVPEILALQLGSAAGLSGSVVHDSGALPLVATLVLGDSPNPVPTPAGAGTYTMNGGTLTGSDFFIGSKGAGTFNMNGGVITSLNNMRVSDDNGSTGVLNMNGGEITLPSFLLVGHGNGTNGTLNFSGGTITVANYNIGQHPTARGQPRRRRNLARGQHLRPQRRHAADPQHRQQRQRVHRLVGRHRHAARPRHRQRADRRAHLPRRRRDRLRHVQHVRRHRGARSEQARGRVPRRR
jgi:hypothetical protein